MQLEECQENWHIYNYYNIAVILDCFTELQLSKVLVSIVTVSGNWPNNTKNKAINDNKIKNITIHE